jgi:hypothetical protein
MEALSLKHFTHNATAAGAAFADAAPRQEKTGFAGT